MARHQATGPGSPRGVVGAELPLQTSGHGQLEERRHRHCASPSLTSAADRTLSPVKWSSLRTAVCPGECQRSGVASSFGLGRIGERGCWTRAIGVAVVAGEHRDRGNDARIPVPDEFPRPQDPDDQQCDQQVADQPGSATAVGIQDENDAPASSNANVARTRAISPSCRGTWRCAVTAISRPDRGPGQPPRAVASRLPGEPVCRLVPGWPPGRLLPETLPSPGPTSGRGSRGWPARPAAGSGRPAGCRPRGP